MDNYKILIFYRYVQMDVVGWLKKMLRDIGAYVLPHGFAKCIWKTQLTMKEVGVNKLFMKRKLIYPGILFIISTKNITYLSKYYNYADKP